MLVNDQDYPPLKALRALSLSLFIMFLFIVLASFLPGRRLWGINHLAFYTVPVRILGLLLIALSFIPRIALYVYNLFVKIVELFASRSKRGWIFAVVAALIFIAALYLVRVQDHLLSQGEFLSSIITKHTTGETPSSATVGASAVLAKERIAPGTMLLYLLFGKMSLTSPQMGMAGGILILNLLLSGLLVLCLTWYVRLSAQQLPVSVMILGLLLFSGTLVLFSGYLSKYTPFYAFGIFYVLSSFLFLEKKASIIWPVIFFLLAFFMHIFAVFLIPSFVFLLAFAFRGLKTSSRRQALLISLTAFTVAAALVGSASPRFKGYYLPFIGTAETSGVFSLGHLVDIFNICLLILPASALLFSLPSLNRGLKKAMVETGVDLKGQAENAAASHESASLESTFSILLFVPWIFFLFLLKPQLSMARNWDRYVLAALGIFPVMMVGLKRFYIYIVSFPAGASEAGPGEAEAKHSLLYRGFASTVSPAIVMTVILTAAWAGINSCPDKSLSRFEKLLTFEKESAANGYDQLSLYFSERGNMVGAINAAEKAISILPRPSYYMVLSSLYLSVQDTASAIDRMKMSLKKFPDYYTTRYYLVSLLDRARRYGDLIEVCKEGIANEPDEPQYYYFLGKSYVYTGKFREGIAALLQCKSMNPPQEVINRTDRLLRRIHKKK